MGLKAALDAGSDGFIFAVEKMQIPPPPAALRLRQGRNDKNFGYEIWLRELGKDCLASL
jgi:hypothetical protein